MSNFERNNKSELLNNGNVVEQNVLYGPKFEEVLEEAYLKKTLGMLLFDQMKKHGEKIAQVNADDDTNETFASLRLRSILVAQELRSRGICEGDMVTVCARNSADTYAAVLGALFVPVAISNIAVELDTGHSFDYHNKLIPMCYGDKTLRDIKHLLTIAKPNIIFCDSDVSQKVEEAACAIHIQTQIITFGEGRIFRFSFSAFQVKRGTESVFRPADTKNSEFTAIVIFSSGTIGAPKGIVVSNKMALKIIAFTASDYLTKHSRTLPSFKEVSSSMLITSLHWYSGIWSLLNTTSNGTSRIITTEPFSEEQTLDLIEKYKIAMVNHVTSRIHRIVKHSSVNNYDLSSLKLMLSSGAVLSYKLVHNLRPKLPNCIFVNSYGLSELGILAYNVVGKGKDQSVGKLLTGCSVKIIDVTSGMTLGANKVGEIYAKSEYMTSGYYNNKEETRNAFDEDGWFRTGDLGYYDEDEFIFIMDRLKETIEYMGIQVEPAEVEITVLLHSDVVECGVVGVPHLTDGHHLVAFVQKLPSSKVTEQDITDFVAGRVSKVKQLHGGVVFMERVPMLPTGKPNKRLLKQLAQKISKH